VAGQPGALAARDRLEGSLLSALALRDRAYAFLVERGPATDADLLRHIFGGAVPAGLHDQLLRPLLDDPRLQRVDGVWSLGRQPVDLPLNTLSVTALAISATGPRPARHALLGLAALHVQRSEVVGRFVAAFNPGARVPSYVAQRARLGRENIDELPAFGNLVDDLLAFLGERPVCAQEAHTTWSFLDHEARRIGRTPVTPVLLDINALAELLLDLPGKPSLPSVAQHLGIGVVHVGHPEDEARVLADAANALLRLADASGLHTLSALERALARGTSVSTAAALRQRETARALPEAPGVYLLRDAHDEVLYVGKARRLRSRLRAYVHRPLGATRRLEGLADRVSGIDTLECTSDLEALILEDREIRRLQPRYNTQRRLRAPRVWLHLPPWRAKRVPPRLMLSDGGAEDAPGQLLGPFRNEAAAESARLLAREVFGLDALRRSDDRQAYASALSIAWSFLRGEAEVRDRAIDDVRSQLLRARQTRDYSAMRKLDRLLARTIAYDPADLVLPADPRQACYALIRPAPADGGVEVFVLDTGILVGQACVPPDDVAVVLQTPTPCTQAADRDVVLRWLGAQRAPARLVYLADGGLDSVLDAIAELSATRDA
jgi:DNA polymerase III epsilon subunit-like protein